MSPPAAKPITLVCPDLKAVPEIARTILNRADGRRTFCLHGDLGAGKTTLIQAFCRELGCLDDVSSPTFALIQEYAAPDQDPPLIHHIDAYRLENLEEAFGIGLLEVLDDAAWTFIEWPGILEPILPEKRVEIQLRQRPDSSREIVFLKI